MDALIKARQTEDLTIPHDCMAMYLCPHGGAYIDEIEPFTIELTDIVDKMKEEMVNETRILEGTAVPEYSAENGLSNNETKEDQWRTNLPSGFLPIDRIHTSTPESNNLPAVLNQPAGNIPEPDERFTALSNAFSKVMSDDSGCEIGATNESSVCTVPMISEQTDGTPSVPK